jgi:hypothetical protein
MISLIYIHIGENLPNYIFDSIYQTLLVSPSTKIYVILTDSLINQFRNTISTFNLNLYLNNPINIDMHVECIPISILKIPEGYTKFIESLPDTTKQFRNSFWISTTARFFYIESFMELFKLNNVYHIENDIMIYENLQDIPVDKNKLYMVKDSYDRVIPSILFIPDCSHLNRLNGHMLRKLTDSNNLMNDMQLLGSYSANHIDYFPFDFSNDSSFIMDGAAIGQYIGGIDPRNIPKFESKTLEEQQLLRINNPTIGFINETCTFKPNSVDIFKRDFHLNNVNVPLELFFGRQETGNTIQLKQINNLHIHSKQLYQFSSLNNLKFKDLISGDRIVSLCDFVLLTQDILLYHQNLDKFIDINKVIIIKNFQNINMLALNSYFQDLNKTTIKLFIYTHLLDQFIQYILPYLDNTLSYVLYLHNSDHEIKENHIILLTKYIYITKVYAQNISFYHKRFNLLPIGIANSMFKHGDLTSLYTVMSESYYKKKTHGVYININPRTYAYRHTILQEINQRPNDFIISESKPYKDYLEELSKHRFCLCIRGNGIACHREWECYYLGVIPIIINNKFTNTSVYIKYLQELGLPFYEIKEDNLDRYSNDFFNEELYKKIMLRCKNTLFNLPTIKLSNYQS